MHATPYGAFRRAHYAVRLPGDIGENPWSAVLAMR